MILVVGGTGQVGSLVVRLLRDQDRSVRVLTRRPDSAADLVAEGAEIVGGDLRDPASVEAAVKGVETIVATANNAAPSSKGDARPGAIEHGYANLIKAAERAGVSRFVLASVLVTPVDDEVPQARAKRSIERRLAASPMSALSLRFSPFIEVWLALAGSTLPLRGETRATLQRPNRMLAINRRLSGNLVEERGVLLVPGPATNRNAFLSTHDAAAALVAGIDTEDIGAEADLCGPEVLSWQQVAEVFSDVLNRPVRVVGVPGPAFRTQQLLLAPVAPGLAAIMALNRLMACSESYQDTTPVATRLGLLPLRTVSGVLREKALLGAAATR
jgi:uncharacterized protein YbjT (DUF2867 family)